MFETALFLGYSGSCRVNPFAEDNAVKRFVSRYSALVTAVLSGFDRVVFRGSLTALARGAGMAFFLKKAGVRLLDFKKFVFTTSEQLKAAALADAERLGRPIQFLERSSISKEDLARHLLAKHPVASGLICAFKAIEPCMSFEYHRSQDVNERGLALRPRKCLHIYKYFLHPRFGFFNARIQTWFPFKIQICLNGREWLARQLRRRNSQFKQADNCFTWLGNPVLAQRLMDEQLDTDWPAALNEIARSLNPLHEKIFAPWPMDYYWSGYQTEWASDLMFTDPQTLASIYPSLVRHATNHFKSSDVMRFLADKAPGNFTGQIVTSFKDRCEGVRVKHWVRGNSIKMYDKAGSILRIETTIADPNDFKVLRPPHNKPDGKLSWQRLRKGVADLHRRARVSQRANDTYLEALAAVDDTTPCSRLFDAVARPVLDEGHRYRAIRIGDPDDIAMLAAITRGEFAVAGFRNRDLQRLLYPNEARDCPAARRRVSARVGRKLRLLRAHGLIRRVQKTHRYRLTTRGQLLAAALSATRDASLKQLNVA